MESTPLIEKEIINRLGQMDIYDISWYSFYLYKIGRLNRYSNIVSHLTEKFNAILADSDKLKLTMYSRKTGVGLILGYYVLKKIGQMPRIDNLDYIIQIIKKYNWYAYNGEILFALDMLIRDQKLVKRNTNVIQAIEKRSEELYKKLRNYNLDLNELKDLCYLLLCKTFNIRFKSEFKDIIFSDYIQGKSRLTLETYYLYIWAFSNYIISYPKVQLIKDIKYLQEKFRHISPLTYPRNLPLSLLAKIKLAKFNYNKARKRLKRYIYLRNEKRKIGFESIFLVVFTSLLTYDFLTAQIKLIIDKLLPLNVGYIFTQFLWALYLSILGDMLTRSFTDYKSLIEFIKMLLNKLRLGIKNL